MTYCQAHHCRRRLECMHYTTANTGERYYSVPFNPDTCTYFARKCEKRYPKKHYWL